MMRTLPSFFVSLFLSVSVAGCAGGFVEVEVSSNALTEEPGAQPTRSLLVTVTEVDVHVVEKGGKDEPERAAPEGEIAVADAQTAADAEQEQNGWVTVFEGEQEINLLDAAAASAFLGGAAVPAGKITQLRLVLAGEALLLDGDQRFPVSCPSCTEAGLKLNPSGKLEVAEGGALSLTLEFDQEGSLTEDSEGLRMSPVIKLGTKE
jgi:hypothetical protein